MLSKSNTYYLKQATNSHLSDFREPHIHRLDLVGLILFGSGIALLSYVLEIFGEHTLSSREIAGLLALSLVLLLSYWLHARTLIPSISHPCADQPTQLLIEARIFLIEAPSQE